jgi:ankyrin repeat protein
MDNVDLRRSEKYAVAFEAAIKNGHVEAVRLLLNNEIMVDLPLDGIGTAAISIASERGHEEIVRLLLEHGAC